MGLRKLGLLFFRVKNIFIYGLHIKLMEVLHMNKKQKMTIGFAAVQAVGGLIALIGVIGEAVVTHTKS
jgi:hypothetical protein